jgi:hypothetical protein
LGAKTKAVIAPMAPPIKAPAKKPLMYPLLDDSRSDILPPENDVDVVVVFILE